MVSIIGDGAAWIRNLTAAGSPEATCIVDLYHPREPLHSLTRSPEFMLGGPARTSGSPPRLEDLDYGYIDGIAADPSHSPAPARVGAESRRPHRGW